MTPTLPLAAAALCTLLLVAPEVARRAAWRAVAREDPRAARRAARVLRALRPVGIGAGTEAMVSLAARAQEGVTLDATLESARLGSLAPAAREVFAVALDAWAGKTAEAAARLDVPSVRDAAIAQGELALALAVLGETRGADELCALWKHAEVTRLRVAMSREAAGELLVLAAHLGQLPQTDALLDALAHELPPARRSYWRAIALQRAGRASEGDQVLARALDSQSPPASLRARLSRLRARPLTPAELGESVSETLVSLRDRVDARLALAELGWHPARGPAWATLGALTALFAGYLGAWMRGAPSEASLDACGALTVPLRGAGEAWRLLSYALLHANAAHLGVNALTLATFGRFVERRLGATWFIAALILGTLVGALAALASAPAGSLVIGASAGVFALVGASVAYIAGEPRLRRTPEVRGELALLAALLLAQGVYDRVAPQVSGGAHLGGVLVGLALGAIRARRATGRPLRALAE